MIKWTSPLGVSIQIPVDGPDDYRGYEVTGQDDVVGIIRRYLETAPSIYGHSLANPCSARELAGAIASKDLKPYRFELVEGGDLIQPFSTDLPEGAMS